MNDMIIAKQGNVTVYVAQPKIEIDDKQLKHGYVTVSVKTPYWVGVKQGAK